MKQLLKTCNDVNGKFVRPFVVMLYVLSKVDYLSTDEFKYLLPLCVDAESTEFIIQQIHRLRTNDVHIDDIIIERLMSMDNYQTALQMFIDNDVDEDLICTVGMNRKSRSYDRAYYPLYLMLRRVFIDGSTPAIGALYEATKQIKIGKYWRSYLFDTTSILAIDRNPIEHLNHTIFSDVGDEVGLKVAFFKIMHLFKAKATLSDYLDLNRRYIKTTDVILFEDDMVKMDIVPKQFFTSVMDGLYAIAFTKDNMLQEDCNMEDINPILAIDESTIISGFNEEYGVNIITLSDVYRFVREDRYRRFHQLVDDKFTDEQLIALLEHFENRDDDVIRSMVTDNADIPTIFEYVLGIIWYKVSEMQGDILSYMKLSLEADLLPKTHAGGGEADLVYEYAETAYYPQHNLLIEATLASDTNQRRMEMEPVSRHLGRHLIRTGNMNSYCVFITPYLDINVVSDFRSRKGTPYYDTQDNSQYVDGMKIIPLDTEALKAVIYSHTVYRNLYDIFDSAFQSEALPHEWYDNYIKSELISN